MPAQSLISGSANNINAATSPFVSPALPALPFMIATNSLCVNTGTVLPWMNANAVDCFGDPRVSGIAPDIGAYEFQSTHPPIAVAEPAGEQILSPSGFAMAFKTRYGWRYTVKTSSDLITWVPVATMSNIPGDGSVWNYVDPNISSAPRRFYRVESSN